MSDMLLSLSEESFESSEILRLSLETILSGPAAQKQAKFIEPFILYTVFGFNQKEIADVLGLGRPVISWRLARAEKELEILLRENGIEGY